MDNNKKQQQNFTRPNNLKACQSIDSNRKSTSTDLQASKPWPRNSRRREQPSTSRNDSQRNSKQRSLAKVRPNVDKRPRPRGGGWDGGDGGADYGGISGSANNSTHALACTSENISVGGSGLVPGKPAYAGLAPENMHLEYELNSVYAPGSRKQNLNHLLNFHYAPRESDYSMSVSPRGGIGGGGNMHRHNKSGTGGKKHKYNKEQFLQANFQFVIKSSAKPEFTASPDTLIDWNLIEQINIQTTEPLQCPICLYPPKAAKLTRCGHVYCWPCILHYLALGDKTWRKCPICYEAIHKGDLKSTTLVQQRQINIGERITFNLMRRKKGSLFIEKFKSAEASVERYPQFSKEDETKLFSKFLIAKRNDILDIIERERRELMEEADHSCPEYIFTQQALDLLEERLQKVVAATEKEEEDDDEQRNNDINGMEKNKDNGEVKNNEINQVNVVHNPESVEEADENGERMNDEGLVHSQEADVGSAKTKYYYFYQCEDGQNIYLHPLNVKMLQACYGSLDRAPVAISAGILQKEYHSVDEEHRRKFTCLGHLPLTCQFAVVEVDLQPPVVTADVLKLFRDDIAFRKRERQRRDREERKRERHINELNDRQMGKLIASTANLQLGSVQEFPNCGFDEFLMGPGVDQGDGGQGGSRHATYSAVAVGGETLNLEDMPPLGSPSTCHSSYKELSTWGKASIAGHRRAALDDAEVENLGTTVAYKGEDDFDAILSLRPTTLSDVLAEAMSQKKQRNGNESVSGTGGAGVAAAAAGGGSKRNKKQKKMLPLFSTGMNYNGNI